MIKPRKKTLKNKRIDRKQKKEDRKPKKNQVRFGFGSRLLKLIEPNQIN
jgi:hypothetical protein